MRENLANFAASTLALTMLSGDTTLTVNGGDGALFPTVDGTHAPYVICVESELLTVTAKTGDVLTVTRGAEGTTAVGHTAGVAVVQGISAGVFNHLWGVVPDSANRDVPPWARGGVLGATDSEFESATVESAVWTAFPSSVVQTATSALPATTSAVYWAAPSSQQISDRWRASHLVFTRGDLDGATYTLYKPYTTTAGAPFRITCKLAHGLRLDNVPANAMSEVLLFVSAASTPTSLAGTSFFGLASTYGGGTLSQSAKLFSYSTVSQSVPMRWAHAVANQVGNPSGILPATATLAPLGAEAIYLRVAYNGAGGWIASYATPSGGWIGLQGVAGFPLNPASLGVRLSVTNGTAWRTQEEVAIDWVRVESGTAFTV